MKSIVHLPILSLVVAFLCFQSTTAQKWTYKTTPSTCAATYGDPCGQDYWGKVSATCESGEAQTPIDFSNVEISTNLTQPAVKAVGGGCNTWVQFSTNYTFEVAFQDSGHVCNNLQLTYNSQVYTMQQIHFHTPSEHTVGGGYFSGEAHMVHKNSAGDLLVLGVFLQAAANELEDSNNTFFQTLWEIGEGETFTGEEVIVSSSDGHILNPYNGLIPGRFSNYRYRGSLTTPPCTEGVQWFVFDQPIQISQDDLKILRKAAAAKPTTTVSEFGNTNRYTHPLNNRTVLYSGGEAPPKTYVSYDDDGFVERLNERLSIAAIVLSCFSTVVTLLISLLVLSFHYKAEAFSSRAPNVSAGVEMKPPSQGGPQYSQIDKVDTTVNV
eukprot:gene12425-13588_t